jgi:hypothetical protein
MSATLVINSLIQALKRFSGAVRYSQPSVAVTCSGLL